MKVGIFTDTYSPDINGVVTSIQQLENELIKHGHEVYIITSSAYRRITRENNVIRLPGIALKKLYGYHISGFYDFFGAHYIKKLNLDLIHAQTEYGIGIFARIIALRFSLPLVYTYHTMMEDYSHYITNMTRGHFQKQVKHFMMVTSKLYADKCTELIVPSQKTADAMVKYGVKNTINVIPTGIDLSAFSSHNFTDEQIMTLRKKYQIDNNDFLAIFVGRIAPEKSVEEIIAAFVQINKQKNKNTKIKFLIVGDGPSYDEIQQLVIDQKLEKQIILTGRISHQEIPLYYQIADIFVSTSITETQGLTFIEAMASNLPVICKDDENLEELVIDKVNGFFIKNVKELANKLIELANLDQYEYSTYGQKAKEITGKYSSAMFYEKVIIVYDTAIRNKRRESLKVVKDHKRKKFI